MPNAEIKQSKSLIKATLLLKNLSQIFESKKNKGGLPGSIKIFFKLKLLPQGEITVYVYNSSFHKGIKSICEILKIMPKNKIKGNTIFLLNLYSGLYFIK